MAGSVSVRIEASLIIAEWRGQADPSILKRGQDEIRRLLDAHPGAGILHDTLQMDDPDMHLALQMRAFDVEIEDRVKGIATLVHSAKTAFLAKISFALAKNHKVFHDDPESARAWLRGL